MATAGLLRTRWWGLAGHRSRCARLRWEWAASTRIPPVIPWPGWRKSFRPGRGRTMRRVCSVQPQRAPATLPTGRKRRRGHGLRGALTPIAHPHLARLRPAARLPRFCHSPRAQPRDSGDSGPPAWHSLKEPEGSPTGATTTGHSYGREELVTTPQWQMAGGALAQGQVPGPGQRGVCLGVWHPREWGDPRTPSAISVPCCTGGPGGHPCPAEPRVPLQGPGGLWQGLLRFWQRLGCPPCLWPCAGRHPGQHVAVTP